MGDSERVTLRISADDLRQLDMLVEMGAFSNRSEAVRQGIRDLIRSRAKEVAEDVAARTQLQETFLQIANMKAQLEEQQKLLENLMKQ